MVIAFMDGANSVAVSFDASALVPPARWTAWNW